jgi:hypothetical protein
MNERLELNLMLVTIAMAFFVIAGAAFVFLGVCYKLVAIVLTLILATLICATLAFYMLDWLVEYNRYHAHRRERERAAYHAAMVEYYSKKFESELD